MRKSVAGLTAVLVLGLTSAASGHPSENRNERAFHGGPHCHTNVHSEKPAFPSHRAHLASGPGNVFNASACPE
jgi:hypothetical protein